MNSEETTPSLFGALPSYPVPLPQAALLLLARLPEWPTIEGVEFEDWPEMNMLERRGLIRVSRERTDPASDHRMPFAGRLPLETSNNE